MRYYSFNEFDGTDNIVCTMSEEEIRKEYYPYWLDRMNKKFGEQFVRKMYCFEDCLDDWIVINWAWEV